MQVACDSVQTIEQVEVLGWLKQHDRPVTIEERTRATQGAQLLGDPRGVTATVQFVAGEVTAVDEVWVEDNDRIGGTEHLRYSQFRVDTPIYLNNIRKREPH